MKKTRFTETQIVKALKEQEAGRKAEDIAREMGVSKATFYNWRSKYGGMQVREVKRLKELEEENRKLKAMYADLALDHKILKDIIENLPADRQESSKACCQTATDPGDY